MAIGAIVVGIDGSRSSRDALRWAIDEARVRRTVVEAVHVWRYPVLTYAAMMATAVSSRGEMEAAAGAMLDREVDDVLGGEYDAPPVERIVLEGPAASRLAEYASDADLLVVGRRGRGLAALLPGSVAQQCSAHAACPVVVVAGHPRSARVLRWPVGATGSRLAA